MFLRQRGSLLEVNRRLNWCLGQQALMQRQEVNKERFSDEVTSSKVAPQGSVLSSLCSDKYSETEKHGSDGKICWLYVCHDWPESIHVSAHQLKLNWLAESPSQCLFKATCVWAVNFTCSYQHWHSEHRLGVLLIMLISSWSIHCLT